MSNKPQIIVTTVTTHLGYRARLHVTAQRGNYAKTLGPHRIKREDAQADGDRYRLEYIDKGQLP